MEASFLAEAKAKLYQDSSEDTQRAVCWARWRPVTRVVLEQNGKEPSPRDLPGGEN